jgi:transmembrane sensor
MTEQDIIEILKKYHEGTLNAEETAGLESWYLDTASKSKQQLSAESVEESKRLIRKQLPLSYLSSPKKSVLRSAGTWVVAASVTIVLSAALYLYVGHTAKPGALPDGYANDIEPGKNSATLTLGSGRRIQLENLKNGEVAKEAGVHISKTADGKLVYTVNSDDKSERSFNILTTHNGEQAQLILPDGSAVWLNAASSLTFPTTFSGSDHRAVKLTGEAYFEISKNPAQPFFVKTDRQEIRVLGTHFNVSNYMSEYMAKTTLLEGSILLNGNTQLKPGQQAEITSNGITVSKVDPELAIAWKNNKFMFENESIENIMKLVQRWYDVEVVYEGDLPDDKFGGSVSRFDKVSKVLGMLELTGNVHFKIAGRRITVMK